MPPDAATEIAERVIAAHPEPKALDVAGITADRLQQAATRERYKEAHEELIKNRGKITRQKVQEVVDNIDPANATVRSDVKTGGDRIADFLDGKIAARTPEHTFIIKQVYNALSQDPHHARKLQLASGITNPENDTAVVAYIETILHDKNSRYELFLVRNAGAALEMSNQIDPALLQEIQAKKAARDLADAEQNRRQSDFTTAETAFDAVDSQLKDYDHTKQTTGAGPDKCVGKRAQDIEDLRAEKPQLEVDRDAGQRKLKIDEDRLGRLQQIKDEYDKAKASDRKAILATHGYRDDLSTTPATTAEVLFNQALQTAETTVNDIYEKEVQPHETKLKTLESLEAEERRLRQEHKDLKKERNDAAAAHQKAGADFQDAHSKHTEAENRKKAIEKTIQSELEGVFGRAAREYTLDFVKVYTDALFEDFENFKEIVPDKHMSAVITAIQKYLFTDVDVKERYGSLGLRTRTRKERRINEALLNQHIKDLQDVGFDGFIESLLYGTSPAFNPETGKGYTMAEVNRLLADRKFLVGVGDQMFKSFMVAAELSESGLNQEQLFALSRIPQSKGKMEADMRDNASFRAKVDEKAREGDRQGTFENAPPAEKARRAIAMDPMILIMLLGNTFSQLAEEEEAEERRRR